MVSELVVVSSEQDIPPISILLSDMVTLTLKIMCGNSVTKAAILVTLKPNRN